MAVLEIVPGDAVRRELQEDSDQALDELIGDALDRLCSENLLTGVQRHGERTLEALTRGDIADALRQLWEAAQMLLQAFLEAAEEQWQLVLHLLLDVLLKGAQEVIGSLLKQGLATIAAVPVEEVEEKAESAQDRVKKKGAELKEHLTDRIETLQERISEEVDKVKERVTEGLQSAAKGGAGRDSFGHPPTGRPPSMRPPSGRPPTGLPPSAHPPSGRPPSLTRRQG